MCVQYRFVIAAGWLQQQISVFLFSLFKMMAIMRLHFLLPMINLQINRKMFSTYVVLCRIITDEDIGRVWDCVVTGIDMMAEEQADG